MSGEGQLYLRLLPHLGREADLRGVVTSYSAEPRPDARRAGSEDEGRDDAGTYRRRRGASDEDVQPDEAERGRVAQGHRHGEKAKDHVDHGRQYRDVLSAYRQYVRTTPFLHTMPLSKFASYLSTASEKCASRG